MGLLITLNFMLLCRRGSSFFSEIGKGDVFLMLLDAGIQCVPSKMAMDFKFSFRGKRPRKVYSASSMSIQRVESMANPNGVTKALPCAMAGKIILVMSSKLMVLSGKRRMLMLTAFSMAVLATGWSQMMDSFL